MTDAIERRAAAWAWFYAAATMRPSSKDSAATDALADDAARADGMLKEYDKRFPCGRHAS